MYPWSVFYVLLMLSVSLTTLNGCISNGHASEPLWEALSKVKATAFSGPQNAWLVVDNGDLWRTGDGGISWEKVSGEAVGGGFYNVSFIDSRRGWAVGNHGVVWYTEDGGRMWARVGLISAPGRSDWVFMGSPQMHFVDERHGWLLETLSVWRTEDGGQHWKQVLSVLDERIKGQPVSGAFESSTAAIISGTGGELYATNDGGETWHVKTLLDSGDFRHISFLDKRKGWLIGSGAPQRGTALLLTENGGENWQPVTSLTTGASIYSLYFIDDKEGWAVGRALPNYPDKQISRSGLVLHTLDGGETWQQVLVGKGEVFFDKVFFPDRQQGWLFSREKVYRTNDSGKSWRVVINFNP
jgi:photosystem II stability/assembly factor-like uncharacterized protein